MAKPIEWSETVHQDITQTVRMTVTRTWTDKYGTPHREDKPPTFADLVAVLGLMPADERVAVVGPLIGDALALQWESALTAATALTFKLEAALGQTEKELHECRIALKEVLGGLDSVKDQNADLRRQLRRLQTGTEIESDRLTDVELNLQATVDRVMAERDKAINDRNAVLRL